VHECFDQKVADVALTRGLELGLKEQTVRGWVNVWKRSNKKKVKVEPEAVA
jgi:hypothetical protein